MDEEPVASIFWCSERVRSMFACTTRACARCSDEVRKLPLEYVRAATRRQAGHQAVTHGHMGSHCSRFSTAARRPSFPATRTLA